MNALQEWWGDGGWMIVVATTLLTSAVAYVTTFVRWHVNRLATKQYVETSLRKMRDAVDDATRANSNAVEKSRLNWEHEIAKADSTHDRHDERLKTHGDKLDALTEKVAHNSASIASLERTTSQLLNRVLRTLENGKH